jgi:UDP-N-acetyl-D-glucosamine dehydrogenase
MSELLSKIESKSAHVVVLGIGCVGLPLCAELARVGFRTTGLDCDAERVRLLNCGESYLADVPSSELSPHVISGRLRATGDARSLRDADVVLVCVPTPLNKTKEPDLRAILEVTDQIAHYQHANMLIVLESTTYPGLTSEVLVPKFTGGEFRLGSHVFVAFSPERVDPGNAIYKTRNTPKGLGGATPECLKVAQALYSRIIETVVPVSSTTTAEMVKLLENTFRAVNIGLVNEMAIMSRRLGVDPFEVIRAAATKPFGFMPFYPGPGLGGHCIPVDPLHLSWKMRSLECRARFIELADSINSGMPDNVVERIAEALNDQSKPVRGSSILVYGVAYKRNVSDVRESPALAIIDALRRRGARVAYMDPFVPKLEQAGSSLRSVEPRSSFGSYDSVVVVTDHDELDRERLLREAKLVIDTRDALYGIAGDRSRVYGL